jgi:hypothetical protein
MKRCTSIFQARSSEKMFTHNFMSETQKENNAEMRAAAVGKASKLQN